MFKESLDLGEALKVVKCPRCYIAGLEVIDYETFVAASVVDMDQATCTIYPSKPIRCTTCGLVMEWPGYLE